MYQIMFVFVNITASTLDGGLMQLGAWKITRWEGHVSQLGTFSLTAKKKLNYAKICRKLISQLNYACISGEHDMINNEC